MTVLSDTHNHIIQVNGKEYHYPKAVWSEKDAREHLENYFREVGNFESKRKVRK